MAIEEDAGLAIVAEASDGEAALALIERIRPQVGVLDIDMPKLDGFGVAREIAQEATGGRDDFSYDARPGGSVAGGTRSGAKGYILKDSALLEIVAAVRAVAAGQPYLNSILTARLLQRQSLAPRAHRMRRWTASLQPNAGSCN